MFAINLDIITWMCYSQAALTIYPGIFAAYNGSQGSLC